MLTWSGRGIKLMSTADTTVSIAPQRFLPQLTSEGAKIEGHCGSIQKQSGRISMRLYEGETIRMR